MDGINFKDYNFQLHKRNGVDVNYQAARQDGSGDPSYFGWVSEDGSWVIIEQNDANGTFLYFRGDGIAVAQEGNGTLAEGWADRTNKTYVEYNALYV